MSWKDARIFIILFLFLEFLHCFFFNIFKIPWRNFPLRLGTCLADSFFYLVSIHCILLRFIAKQLLLSRYPCSCLSIDRTTVLLTYLGDEPFIHLSDTLWFHQDFHIKPLFIHKIFLTFLWFKFVNFLIIFIENPACLGRCCPLDD